MKNLIERAEAKLDEWGAKLEQKNIEYPVDLICGILFLVIGIVLLLIMPQQVQISEKDVVNGRAFPTMLIWLMLAMSALLVGREAYNMVMHRPTKTKTLNLLVETKALVIVLILVVTYLLAEVTDLFVVGAVFCALAFLVFFRCKKPLYYAITVSPGIHHTMGGVKINTETQVLKKDGQAIAGLYAAGEVTGGLHGKNRIGGNAVADIIIFGRQAGTQAAAYAKK